MTARIRALVAVIVTSALAFGSAAWLGGTVDAGAAKTKRHATVATIGWNPAIQTGLSTAGPPWALPADARFDIANAGLAPQPGEITRVHYHAHLDVIDNGTAVTVPAGVGFIIQNNKVLGLTFLHTHDSSGVIHIESPTRTAYALGQFITEWGVSIGRDHLGGLATGNGMILRTFVNGNEFKGNPGQIVLTPHDEIAIWYGPVGQTPHVPASYRFPAGE